MHFIDGFHTWAYIYYGPLKFTAARRTAELQVT